MLCLVRVCCGGFWARFSETLKMFTRPCRIGVIFIRQLTFVSDRKRPFTDSCSTHISTRLDLPFKFDLTDSCLLFTSATACDWYILKLIREETGMHSTLRNTTHSYSIDTRRNNTTAIDRTYHSQLTKNQNDFIVT
jgi:hypothetical protein